MAYSGSNFQLPALCCIVLRMGLKPRNVDVEFRLQGFTRFPAQLLVLEAGLHLPPQPYT